MALSSQFSDLSPVTAVVLAGGLGTRLRPVVSDQPKVLAAVGGRPFLAYVLDQLTAAGVRKVVVCAGYLGDQLEAAFHASYRGASLSYSREPSPLGTAGALRLALPLLRSDPVLVMNGDSFCDADLKEFVGWHQVRGARASLLLTEVPDTQRYGRVDVDRSGQVTRFEEKADASGRGLINAGIYLLTQEVLCAIPAHRAVSLEREVLPAWVGRGLYACQSVGAFLDIGTPEAYAQAEYFFRSGTARGQETP
jgi:D-glycero-alpha-D-manno-heptose 1-phosphate guanylyltransferase